MWAKIRSWHRIKFTYRSGTSHRTLCGRDVAGLTSAEFPNDEKTCESCLRIISKEG